MNLSSCLLLVTVVSICMWTEAKIPVPMGVPKNYKFRTIGTTTTAKPISTTKKDDDRQIVRVICIDGYVEVNGVCESTDKWNHYLYIISVFSEMWMSSHKNRCFDMWRAVKEEITNQNWKYLIIRALDAWVYWNRWYKRIMKWFICRPAPCLKMWVVPPPPNRLADTFHLALWM